MRCAKDNDSVTQEIETLQATLTGDVGFTNVSVEEFVPDDTFLQRVREWMSNLDDPEDMDDPLGLDAANNEEFIRSFRWVTVQSKEGLFRIGFIPPLNEISGASTLVIDLQEIGLTFSDMLESVVAMEGVDSASVDEIMTETSEGIMRSAFCPLMMGQDPSTILSIVREKMTT